MEPVLTPMTLAQLLTDVGSIITQLLTWIPNMLSAALASPVVVVFIGLAIVGTVVAFGKKILHF